MKAMFRDRRDAGLQLAGRLQSYARRNDVLVLALPRGGVPIAFAVAEALEAPLDVLVTEKLGVPGFEELAMGAITAGGSLVLNDEVIQCLGVSRETIERVAFRQWREILRQERIYRGDRPPLEVKDQVVILIGDGLATGSTMRAAALAMKDQGAARRVIAAPIGAPDTCQALKAEADELVYLCTPDPFYSVSQGYQDFSPITEEEVRDLLERAAHRHAPLVP